MRRRISKKARRSKTVVIVGLGLIGGSLAARFRARARHWHVVGVSRKQRTIRTAIRQGFIHEGFTRLKPAARQADCVIICTPVDTIPKLILQVDRYARRGTLVTDAGSTKRKLVSWADRNCFQHIFFVGSHPLAGSHARGIGHAQASLLDHSLVIVTPSTKTNRKALAAVVRLWKQLGLAVRRVTAERHDRIVSEISHVPHATASALVQVVRPDVLGFASSGFLDTTRVAQGDPRLWTPIFTANRAQVSRGLGRVERVLSRFRKAVMQGRQGTIYRLLAAAQNKRKRISTHRR